ncbi:MAG: GntR family transcriptional regulator [Planctomycetota bacterium]
MRSRGVSPLVQRTANGVIDLIATKDMVLPAESAMALQLGVSRSPLRRALDLLRQRGVVRDGPEGIQAARRPRTADRFAIQTPHHTKSGAFTDLFLAKLARGDLKPGQEFSELELAREAGLSTVPIREALLAISAVGLIAKVPRRHWVVVRFTDAMVDELYDLRILLELEVLSRAMTLAEDHPVRAELHAIQQEHDAMRRSTHDVERFLDLDQRFHGSMFRAGGNRFITREFSAISTLLRFQLQPTEVGIRGMELGLEQHPPIITAILDQDLVAGKRLIRAHLCTSRELMKQSLGEVVP